MIKITNKSPIRFDEIVREMFGNLLDEYGFIPEEIFFSSKNEDLVAGYCRMHRGTEERISIFRREYFDEYKDESDDEVEKEPYTYPDNSDFKWISRHWFQILLTANYKNRNLLTTGEAGIGRNGEEYWFFEDEEDLRKLLKETIVPLITTVAMKDFHEQLEDELEYSAKKKNEQTNHEQISNALS